MFLIRNKSVRERKRNIVQMSPMLSKYRKRSYSLLCMLRYKMIHIRVSVNPVKKFYNIYILLFVLTIFNYFPCRIDAKNVWKFQYYRHINVWTVSSIETETRRSRYKLLWSDKAKKRVLGKF